MLDRCGPRPFHRHAPARGTRQLDKRPCAPLSRNARDTLTGRPSPSTGNTDRDCADALPQPRRKQNHGLVSDLDRRVDGVAFYASAGGRMDRSDARL